MGEVTASRGYGALGARLQPWPQGGTGSIAWEMSIRSWTGVALNALASVAHWSACQPLD